MPAVADPFPGSLTVPPFSGWEVLGVALLAVVLLAVGFLLVGALAPDRRHRSAEWQAFLDGRSRDRAEETADRDAGQDAAPVPQPRR